MNNHYNQNKENNQLQINSITGFRFRGKLFRLKTGLILLEVISSLVNEGITRASASQLAEQIPQQSKRKLTALFIGQLLSELKVPSVISHGKKRFILDPHTVDECRRKLEASYQALTRQTESSQEAIRELALNVENLEKHYQEIVRLQAKQYNLETKIRAIRSQDRKVFLQRKED